MIIPQRNFKRLLNNIDEDTFATDLKDNNLDLIPSIFMERGIAFTLDNVIKMVFEVIGRYSGLYSSLTHRKESDGSTTVIFTHGYDIKWSRILAVTFSDFIKTHLRLSTEYSILPSTITIKISKD